MVTANEPLASLGNDWYGTGATDRLRELADKTIQTLGLPRPKDAHGLGQMELVLMALLVLASKGKQV